jgi:hypothetical protein
VRFLEGAVVRGKKSFHGFFRSLLTVKQGIFNQRRGSGQIDIGATLVVGGLLKPLTRFSECVRLHTGGGLLFRQSPAANGERSVSGRTLRASTQECLWKC